MPRLILLLALLLALYFLYTYLRQLPPQNRRRTTATAIITLLALAAVVLTITGRMHWIGAALTGLLVALRQFGPTLLKFMPALHAWRTQKQQDQASPPPAKTTMTRQEALDALGLADPVSETDVIAAHRSLMQKIHPDRGGNDYLAAKINQAKDILLKG